MLSTFLAEKASQLLVMAALSACPQPGKVDVQVTLKVDEKPYITDVTSQWLTDNFGNDPDGTLATDGKWMVGGLMKSNLSGAYNAQFSVLSDRKTGNACLSVRTVTYTINYAPQIYIASDYKHLGCRYSQTMAHEKRHVQTDKRVFNEFIPKMKNQIRKHVESMPAQGPYAPAQLPQEQQRILQQIAQSIKTLEGELIAKRRQEQAKIDTLENYQRDTALCPGQFPKFDGSTP